MFLNNLLFCYKVRFILPRRNIIYMLLDTLINAINGMLETYIMYGKDDITKLKKEMMDLVDAFNEVNKDRFAVELKTFKKANSIVGIIVTVRNPLVNITFRRCKERIAEDLEGLIYKIKEELHNPNKSLESIRDAIKGHLRLYTENIAPVELKELKKDDDKVTCIVKSRDFEITIEENKI
jgi:hypothetical protein